MANHICTEHFKMRAALFAIRDTYVDENTDHAQLTALLRTIARRTLEDIGEN